jgi:DNA-binding transcriptional regulator PaaX
MILADLLLTYLDVAVETFEIFDAHGYYKKDIGNYRRWRKKSKIDARTAYNLKKLGYIKSNSNDEFYLTKKAIKKINHRLAQNIQIPVPQKWDLNWRIVIISTPKKSDRDLFLKQLRKLGFFMLSRGVYCHPFPCQKEVHFIAGAFGVRDGVTFIEANYIDTKKDYSAHFRQKGFI